MTRNMFALIFKSYDEKNTYSEIWTQENTVHAWIEQG